ncbi:eukaryotic translation initiation factor 5A, partial [Aspergillus ruber CBS 135680]
SDLRKNGHVVIKGNPCKIVDMSSSRTGKHGQSKTHINGVNIFTGKKFEDIFIQSQTVDVPIVRRNEYKLDGSHDGYLVLRDIDGNTKTDIAIPEDDTGVTIMNYLDSGDACKITVLEALNEQACIETKDA